MKKFSNHRFLSIITLTAMLVAAVYTLALFASCNNLVGSTRPASSSSSDSSDGGTGDTSETSVTLNTTALSLSVGGSAALTATVSPANTAITWSSSNNAVATVNNRTVTAVAVGTATITVTAAGGKTATCAVTVSAQMPGSVAVSSVSLNTSDLSLMIGGTVTTTLTAGIVPANAINKAVSWSSSNPSVATVSNGVVTAKGPGTATITVTTSDGGKTAACTITVSPAVPANVPVTGVTLDKNTLTLTIGGTANETLTATVNPGNATNKNVSWSSSNTGVATVSNGTVTAKGPGTATITVTTNDGGKTASCTVGVTQVAGTDSITISFSGLPGDETSNLTGGTTTLSWSNGTLNLNVPTANFSGASYQWYLDGQALSGKTGSSLTMPGNAFTLGSHQIILRILTTDKKLYSKSLQFTVQ